MKFESLILASLFAVCFAVCALVMGAMLTATPDAVQLAGAHKTAVVVPAARAG
ncbi:hypothetical protein [Rhodanobacter sp. KK11]|jgi:hypothetical protein|uniref:hypothetical protein n=1 Tax=Rhodanobacter sp. KK11 TaxID=3083255 RepID=UPI002965EA8A|nr:hypothetical protein [Rhodanobacter sp. KK11]MDW2982821.1 hypothetical protein [Rhodanobacter sp. KK11]